MIAMARENGHRFRRCRRSDGRKEYAECLLKMKFLTDPVRRFELIETMLYDGANGFWLSMDT